MGVEIPISIENLKKQRLSLRNDIEKIWKGYFGDFPIITNLSSSSKYVLDSIVILSNDNSSNNINSQFRVQDIQYFYKGQEIELIEHVEHILREFKLVQITISIKNASGSIESSVNIGITIC